MGRYATLQDELDHYEKQLGEIAQILLDDTLDADETIEAIEEIVFDDEDTAQ
jgi:hypothetical protein